jgi:hypothetical protein
MKTLAALIGMLLTVGAAYADTSTNPKIEKTTKASVTVTKLDVAHRHLTLKNDAGEEYTETAKAGERPGASAQSTTNVPVTIDSVDTQKSVVKFRGNDELVRSTDVVSPEGKAFIKNLKAGDQVLLTYTESVAISVDPTK